jgi:hypothetical protein
MTEWLGIAIALIALFCLLWWLDNREPLSGWFGGWRRAPCQTKAPRRRAPGLPRLSTPPRPASSCLTGRLWRGLIPRPVRVPSMERRVAAVAPRATPITWGAAVVAGSIGKAALCKVSACELTANPANRLATHTDVATLRSFVSFGFPGAAHAPRGINLGRPFHVLRDG